LRTFTPDCDVDAEGARIVWLHPVAPAESVRWLGALAASPQGASIVRPAIAALALHADPTAVPRLIDIATTHSNAISAVWRWSGSPVLGIREQSVFSSVC
jgi:hypothetical protein